MIAPRFHAANHQGRMAVLATRLHGAPPAPCPYHAQTKRARYWHMGQRQAAALLDQLLEHADAAR